MSADTLVPDGPFCGCAGCSRQAFMRAIMGNWGERTLCRKCCRTDRVEEVLEYV